MPPHLLPTIPHLTPCHLLTCVLFNTEESLSAAVVQEQFIVYTHFWSVDTLLHHLQFEEILVKTKCLFCLTLLLFFFFFFRESRTIVYTQQYLHTNLSNVYLVLIPDVMCSKVTSGNKVITD